MKHKIKDSPFIYVFIVPALCVFFWFINSALGFTLALVFLVLALLLNALKEVRDELYEKYIKAKSND